MKRWLLSIACFCLVQSGCKPELPEERFTYFAFRPWHEVRQDTVAIHLANPVACPLRVSIRPDSSCAYLAPFVRDTILLAARDSVTIRFPLLDTIPLPEKPFHYSAVIGDPARVQPDTAFRYSFPFPKGKTVMVMQGYNGKFSHNTDLRRYAIDFRMDTGDTVCAARGGVVVARIDGYDVGGPEDEYRPFANCLFLYHEDGTFARYVHFMQNGVLVGLGDTVRQGQPIGLVGETGYTTAPHVHFDVLKPMADSVGAVSIPVRFEACEGARLRRGVRAAN